MTIAQRKSAVVRSLRTVPVVVESAVLCFLCWQIIIPAIQLPTVAFLDPSYKETRVKESWGDLYAFGEFIRNNTQQDDYILIPESGLNPHLKNMGLISYFAFPRRFVWGHEKHLKRDEGIKYVITGEKAPQFPVPGETMLFKNKNIIVFTNTERLQWYIDDLRISNGEREYDNSFEDTTDILFSDWITKADRQLHSQGLSSSEARTGEYSQRIDATYRTISVIDYFRLEPSQRWPVFKEPKTELSVAFKVTAGYPKLVVHMKTPQGEIKKVQYQAQVPGEDGWTVFRIDDLSHGVPEGSRIWFITVGLVPSITSYPYRDWGLIAVNRSELDG